MDNLLIVLSFFCEIIAWPFLVIAVRPSRRTYMSVQKFSE